MSHRGCLLTSDNECFRIFVTELSSLEQVAQLPSVITQVVVSSFLSEMSWTICSIQFRFLHGWFLSDFNSRFISGSKNAKYLYKHLSYVYMQKSRTMLQQEFWFPTITKHTWKWTNKYQSCLKNSYTLQPNNSMTQAIHFLSWKKLCFTISVHIGCSRGIC